MKGRHPDFTLMHHSLFSYSQSDRRLTFHLIWPLNGHNKKLWSSLGFLYSFPVIFMKRFCPIFVRTCVSSQSQTCDLLTFVYRSPVHLVLSHLNWPLNSQHKNLGSISWIYNLIQKMFMKRFLSDFLSNLYLKPESKLWPADNLFQEFQSITYWNISLGPLNS